MALDPSDVTQHPSSMATSAGMVGDGTALGFERRGTSEWTRRWRRFKQNRLSVVGAGVIVFLAIVALVGPFLAPYPDDATGAVHIPDRLLGPSGDHLMGTDEVGRDVFSRLLIGTRLSLGAGFIILVSATTLGTTLGIISGYFGGKVDTLIQRFTDVFLAIPGLILAMAVASALGPSLVNVVLAISLVWWPGYCRLARGEVMRKKEEPYVESARAVGARQRRIVAQHIFPNILTPILVKGSMDIGFAVLTLASLGFIGLGAQPPTPDWGKMIADGRRYLPESWWLTAFPGMAIFLTPILVKSSMDIGFAVLTLVSLGFIGLGAQPPTPDWGKMIADGRRYLPESWWLTAFPGMAIFLTVFAFNLLGDGIRDVFDPRSRD